MANNGKLSFAVAINLLTDNFKKGSNELKNGFRNIQMQAMSMVAAMGAGTIGFSAFISKLIDTSRETSRATTALKNISGGAIEFGKNQKFLIELASKYGLYVNDLIGNFAKFTAAASNANMPMASQQKLFESLSRACVGFGLSADESNGVFLAITQMMGKGKIQAEELRGQLGERLPIAMQAMAKAAGTSVAGLDSIMKKGELLSADVLPKFATALNEMIPNVNTDNIETSLNRLKNLFKDLTDSLGVGNAYKNIIDNTGELFGWIISNLSTVSNTIVNIVSTTIIGKAFNSIVSAYRKLEIEAAKSYVKQCQAAKVAFDEQAYNANKFSNISKVAFAKVGLFLKSAFNTIAPFLLISAVVELIQKVTEYNQKQKEIKNTWSDYQSGLRKATASEEVTKMKSLLSIINDRKSKQQDVNNAQQQLMGMLNVEKASQQDLNRLVAERAKLIENNAKADYYARSKVEFEGKNDDIKRQAAAKGIDSNEFEHLAKIVSIDGTSAKNTDYFNKQLTKALPENSWTSKSEVLDMINQYNANKLVISDSDNKLKNVVAQTKVSVPTGTPDKKEKKTPLEKAEEEYNNSIKEYKNQLSAGVITQKEYNKSVDELSKKTVESIAGILGNNSKNNSVFNSANKNVINPLYTKEQQSADELEKVQNDYKDKLSQLNQKKSLNLIDEDKYKDELKSLTDSTLDSVLSIKNINLESNEFAKSLVKSSKELNKIDAKKYTLPKRENIDHTFDYKKDNVEKKQDEIDNNNDYKNSLVEKLKDLGADDIEEKIKSAGGDLSKLKAQFNGQADQLINELSEAMKKAPSLAEALKIMQVKKDVKELKEQLATGVYSGVKDVANSAKNMYESFKAVKDTFNDVDSTGWERLLAVWDAITNTTDSILSVIKLIENIVDITNKLAKAKQVEAAIDTTTTATKVANAGTTAGAEVAALATTTTAEVAASSLKTTAASAEMAAKSTAAYAAIPFLGVGLAAGQIATMEAMIAAAAVPKFANGGIVQSSSLSGDKTIIAVNGGEMILNQGQQSTLFSLLNGRGNLGNNTITTGGKVEFELSGKVLKGVLDNYNNIKSKVK